MPVLVATYGELIAGHGWHVWVLFWRSRGRLLGVQLSNTHIAPGLRTPLVGRSGLCILLAAKP